MRHTETLYLNCKSDSANMCSLWVTHHKEKLNGMKRKATTEVTSETDLMLYFKNLTEDADALAATTG